MSASARPQIPDEVIIIAVDPHKASWTAVVVDAGLAAVATIRVAAEVRELLDICDEGSGPRLGYSSVRPRGRFVV